MIIIKGKVGKSSILEDLINNRLHNRSVAIIDTVFVKQLKIPEEVDHFLLDKKMNPIDIYNSGNFKDYEWIIFEINESESTFDLDKFKELDRNSTQNFIVTVQTNDEEVRVEFA